MDIGSRHSECRGGSSSSAVVFLVLSNHQRSTCSCPGCGTSGNSRTARDLYARASGEVHLAPDPQFTIVLSLSSTGFEGMSGSDCCDDVMRSSTLGIMTATPTPVVVAPAPVLEYIQPAPTFQTDRCIPDVLQQLQVGYSAPVPYGALVGAAPIFQTVTAQPGYQYGAHKEVQYAVAPTVTKKKRCDERKIFASTKEDLEHGILGESTYRTRRTPF